MTGHRVDDFDDIQAMREVLGMRPLSRGYVPCYGCGNIFYSEDTDHERHCLKCRKEMAILERSTDGDVPFYHRLNRATTRG